MGSSCEKRAASRAGWAWPAPSAVFWRFDVRLAKRENGDDLQVAASERNVAL